ncbi:MAG: protein kinase [Polyangiaceae bacterium]|nr:protein kinase [Polyangiaceae bacterium]
MAAPGTRIDRFVIDRLLGRGGMAEVYAARDTHLRRVVALKVLHSRRGDTSATQRLLREARAAASFQHPGAVVVYDAFEHDGAAYMAMELVNGRTLRSFVGDASIPIEKRLRWLVDVARTLGAAHRAGLVHRDVKPHNVMVRQDGEIKVLDFGIARAHRASSSLGEDTLQTLGAMTDPGAIVGTPLYASPEQLSAAAVDGRSDQFAWGVTSYELCCGLLPWRRRDTLTMLAQMVAGDIPTMARRVAEAHAEYRDVAMSAATSRSAPPPPDPALYREIPPEIEEVLRRTLAKDPDERFSTIDEAADLLEEHAEPPPSLRFVPRSTFPLPDGVDLLSRSGSTPAVQEAAPGSTPASGRTPASGPRSSPGRISDSETLASGESPGAERPPLDSASDTPLSHGVEKKPTPTNAESRDARKSVPREEWQLLAEQAKQSLAKDARKSVPREEWQALAQQAKQSLAKDTRKSVPREEWQALAQQAKQSLAKEASKSVPRDEWQALAQRAKQSLAEDASQAVQGEELKAPVSSASTALDEQVPSPRGATPISAPRSSPTTRRSLAEVASAPGKPSSSTSPAIISPTSHTGGDLLESNPPSHRDAFQASSWRPAVLRVGAALSFGAALIGGAFYFRQKEPQAPAPIASPSTLAALPARIGCTPATVREGAPPSEGKLPTFTGFPSQPSLYGQAACVRTSVALGVPWDLPSSADAAPLDVTVEVGTSTRVTLKLRGRTASVEGAKPLAAVDAAVRALAGEFSALPVSLDRQKEWGVDNADSARRMEAWWRTRVARLTEHPSADLTDMLSAAPRSTWPQLVLLSDASEPRIQVLRDAVNMSAVALPGELHEAVRASVELRVPSAGTMRRELLSNLRRAYAGRPNDGFVAATLAEALLRDERWEEAAAVGMRMADRAPAESLEALSLLVRHRSVDPAWVDFRARLLDTLTALFPEAHGWDDAIWHDALGGRVEQARARLAFADAMGLPSANARGWARDLTRAAVELADDRPAEARRLLQPFLGSPSPSEAALATDLLVQAHLAEGHVADAETALFRDVERLEALFDMARAGERWIQILSLSRRLLRPPPARADVKKLEVMSSVLEALERPAAAALRVEVFFFQVARKERDLNEPDAVLNVLDGYAQKLARGDEGRYKNLTAAGLPIVFAMSGGKGALTHWSSLERAGFTAKLPYLVAYGTACEIVGEASEAEKAYRAVASAPLAADGLDRLTARFRLAALLRKKGAIEEADKWGRGLAEVLKSADKSVVEMLEKEPR